MKIIACILGLLAISITNAEAKHHLNRYFHFSHRVHVRYSHHWHSRQHAFNSRHTPMVTKIAVRPIGGSLTRAKLADGQTITVATKFVDNFVGFFNALYKQEGKLPEIGCYSPTGHMPGSLHHWGGACDVGQTERNVAAKIMYHVTALAHQFGLTDGCAWRNPDCGHVDVSGVGNGPGTMIARLHTHTHIHYASHQQQPRYYQDFHRQYAWHDNWKQHKWRNYAFAFSVYQDHPRW